MSAEMPPMPQVPLARTLDRVTPFLHPALATSDARARVERVATRLPAALTHWFYLEPRLTGGGDSLDLIVRVEADVRGHLAPACEALRRAAGGDARVGIGWRRLAAFARAWCTPGSAADAHVEGMWLEFDLDATHEAASDAGRPSSNPAAPRVFIDLTLAAYETGSAAERAGRAIRAAASLFAPAHRAGVARRLARVFALLPEGATVPYIGAVLDGPRAGAARACVAGVPVDALGDLLAALGWPGEPAAAMRALDALLPPAQRVDPRAPALVHVDLPFAGAHAPAAIGDTVGLEFAFARAPQVRGTIAEDVLLDALVAGGYCDGARRDALAAWPGCGMTTLPHQLWPSLVLRRLNHVKVVLGPGGIREVKPYLCATHGFYRRRGQTGALYLVERGVGPACGPSAGTDV